MKDNDGSRGGARGAVVCPSCRRLTKRIGCIGFAQLLDGTKFEYVLCPACAERAQRGSEEERSRIATSVELAVGLPHR